MEKQDHWIKRELWRHIKGRVAFLPISEFLEEVPFEKVTRRPNELPYSFYEVFYHVVFAQKDILDFLVGTHYELPQWPGDYWPDQNSVTREDWKSLKENYLHQRQQLEGILKTEDMGLHTPAKHATDQEQTLLREALLILGHTAYHTGQLYVILRLVKAS